MALNRCSKWRNNTGKWNWTLDTWLLKTTIFCSSYRPLGETVYKLYNFKSARFAECTYQKNYRIFVWGSSIYHVDMEESRPIPFYDFAWFVVLILFKGGSGSPNVDRNFFACIGRTTHRKREDNELPKIMR